MFVVGTRYNRAPAGESFFKIVPKGSNINGPSPYYLSKYQLNLIEKEPNILEQILGLPLSSVSNEYDVFKITSKIDGNIVFESIIAPTKQFKKTNLSNFYGTTGGGKQTLIIDNNNVNLWEKSINPIKKIIL